MRNNFNKVRVCKIIVLYVCASFMLIFDKLLDMARQLIQEFNSMS